MAHAQKPDFVFRRNGQVHLNRRGASFQSTTGSRGVRISGGNAGYTMFRGIVKSEYWLPTPFASFPFTSPPVRHRVPSHFNWSLHMLPHDECIRYDLTLKQDICVQVEHPCCFYRINGYARKQSTQLRF
jgi:hypothetical protein